MKQFSRKSAALFVLSSGAMALLMQACGGGDAHAQSTTAAADPIEGLWQSTVSLKDCASGAPLGAFRGLTIFNAGGTANADGNQPSATKGAGLGTWKRTTTGSYTIDLRFWRYGNDGLPIGQQRLTRTITLAADGRSLTSTITTQALDAGDNVVLTGCGTESGARIGS